MAIGQGGSTPGDGKTTPLGDGNGGAGAGGSTDKSPDFSKVTTGGQTGGGGRDFTKEHRSQTANATQEVGPNPQTIPAGGKILLADPRPVSAVVAGSTGTKSPFKGMR